jgi:RimJ/RimL family protein N-acetyltransferase
MIGERVYLRPVENSDAEPFAAIEAQETDTFMWRGPVMNSPLLYDHWIAEEYKQQPPNSIHFAVCLREDDRCIGNVGLEWVDFVNRVGETGSFLGPAEVRSQGYGTEAKHLLLEYAFDRLHLHVIQSFVVETNTRSSAALMKQGYRHAGRMKWVDVKNGRYIDANLYDVKREEWLAAREEWRRQRQSAGSSSRS